MSEIGDAIDSALERRCPLCPATISPRTTEQHVQTVHPEHYAGLAQTVERLRSKSLTETLANLVVEGLMTLDEATMVLALAKRAGVA